MSPFFASMSPRVNNGCGKTIKHYRWGAILNGQLKESNVNLFAKMYSQQDGLLRILTKSGKRMKKL